MKENLNIQGLLDIYDNEVSKSTKNKKKLVKFEKIKMQSLNYLMENLKNETYFIKHYNIFMIKEPKYRIVMSLPIKDKIVNHFITRNCLDLKLTKYLNDRNIAARKFMGVDYGIKKIKRYLELNKKYEKFYILKIDISKFFYSIDHIVLKDLLKEKLDEFEYNLISNIIDSTNEDYINEQIKSLKYFYLKKNPKRREEIENIPFYEKGKGLPIGNITSQFLSIFYLYKLDHYIVHNLKLKYYIRYMDDFVIIHQDKAYLKFVKEKIINILKKEYKLEINEKKTFITSSKNGFSFLGYTFKIVNNKTVVKLNANTINKVIKNIKFKKYAFNKGIISFEQAFSSISTFNYSFKYGSVIKIINAINKCWFN